MSFCLEDQKPQPPEPPSPQLGLFFLARHHLEPHSRTLTGLTLHVQFEGGSAQVSMLDMPGIPEPEQDAGIRAAILRLGEAIVQAKDSHGIVRHHP